MSPHLQRALMLYEQSRHELAEEQLRQALAGEPDDPHAHALLALCLARREKFEEAADEARQAVHLAPDFDFAHYAHASVLLDRNHLDAAQRAIEEALRLAPEDADYWALLSQIRIDQRQWFPALEAAENGLRFTPDHVACTNLRAIALVKLGRKSEAGATIDAALARNPDNSVTHANQGWTLLEQNQPAKALEHFRESLRLDPTNEWARAGIVEALKARNIVYGAMLRYFLWMSKLPTKVQWAVILGGYFLNRMLGAAAGTNPDLAPWILPIRILYIAAALLTWTADPLFNLLLRVNRFGRLALSDEQRIASSWLARRCSWPWHRWRCVWCSVSTACSFRQRSCLGFSWCRWRACSRPMRAGRARCSSVTPPGSRWSASPPLPSKGWATGTAGSRASPCASWEEARSSSSWSAASFSCGARM